MGRVSLAILFVAVALQAGCNVWRAWSPRVHYDQEAPPPAASLEAPALLVYSKTNGFRHEEERYSFAESPRARPGVRVLASVDESTYEPRLRLLWIDRDLAMGDHPVIWSRCVGRGRALYSALGHQAAAFASPDYRGVLEGAVAWAARLEGEGCD